MLNINNKICKVLRSISLVDFLVLFLFVYMFFSNRKNGDDISIELFSWIELSFALYYFLRIIFNIGRNTTYIIVVFILEISSIIECSVAIFQIIGILESKNTIFLCSGLFDNPGPLGGYITSVALVSVNYLISKRNNEVISLPSIIDKLLVYCSFISIILFLVVIPSTQSRASLLSMIVSFLCLTCRYSRINAFVIRHRIITGMIIIFALAIICIFKRPSLNGRIFTYKIASMSIVNHQYKGVGMGHFSNSYGEAQRQFFSKRISIVEGSLVYNHEDNNMKVADNPTVCFNDYLQMGMEFGVGPLLLFIFLTAVSLHHLYINNSPFCYGLLSMTVFGFFSYPFSLWEFRILFLIYIAYSGSLDNNDIIKQKINICYVILYSVPVVLFGPNIMSEKNKKVNEIKWEQQRFMYEAKEYTSYEFCCMQLYDNLRYNCAFLYEYAYSLLQNEKLEECLKIINEGLSISGSSQFYILRGDLNKKTGNIKEAEQDYIDAFMALPDRIYPLYKLALLYYESNQFVCFVNMSKSIDDFKPRIESVSTQDVRDMMKLIGEPN